MTSFIEKKAIARILPCVLLLKLSAILLCASCSKNQQSSDYEMMGRGMLEEKGIHVIPPGYGERYYLMRHDSQYGPEDYDAFFRSIKVYQVAFLKLKELGLSNSEIQHIPDWKIFDAMESEDPAKELKAIARNF